MTTLNRPWYPLVGAFAFGLAALALAGCSSSNGTTTSTGGTGSSTGAATTSGSGTGSGSSGGSTTGGTTGATTGGATTSGGSSGGTSGTGTGGGGNITTVTLQAQGGGAAAFSSPFDAVLTADGNTIYFTGIDSAGLGGVFSTPAPGGGTGGTIGQVAVGGALEAPFGIALSTSEQILYVADPSTSASQKGFGAVLSLSISSGGPLSVSGTEDSSPQSLAVLQEGGADQIYYTGIDVTDGTQAILKIPAAGGVPLVLAKGPFISLSGIAVAGHTVYVVDNGTAGTTVYALDTTVGTPAVLVSGLLTNFPGGIALVQDGMALLVAAIDPTSGKDAFARIVIASKVVSYIQPAEITGFSEPGGLHRSANSDTYAWVDGTANSGGIVSVLK